MVQTTTQVELYSAEESKIYPITLENNGHKRNPQNAEKT